MQQKFQHSVSSQKLCTPGDRILLAISGGVDSMVMARLFLDSGYQCGIAHCNFSLRGKESDADEAFVRRFAIRFSLSYFTIRFNTSAYAATHKKSIQEAARELRYQWFEEIRCLHHFNKIATAHNANDQAETFFINLLRSSGISGLEGIPAENEAVIRPLLFADRNQIVDFARKNKIKWREDSSNLQLKYKRNRIRNELFPVLEKISPYYINAINHSIHLLKNTGEIYRYAIENMGLISQITSDEWEIDIQKLKNAPLPLHCLFEIIKDFHFNSSNCERIFASLESISGKKFYSSTHRLLKERDKLCITNKVNSLSEQLKIEKETAFISSPLSIAFSHLTVSEAQEKVCGRLQIYADAALLKYPLMLRKWRRGDVFYPYGMRGKKKISDFFNDQKFTQQQKENTWLLCSGSDIVWIAAYRADRRFAISNKTTDVLKVELRK